MFTFPPQTAFGKTVPKSRIYTHTAPSRRVRDLFVSQLSEIIWAHKLSPETLRLPARPGVPEIQIFDLTLKTAVLDDDVLHAIDRAIPYPLIHRLHSENGIVFSVAFKRPSEADSSQWVVGPRFTSSFILHPFPLCPSRSISVTSTPRSSRRCCPCRHARARNWPRTFSAANAIKDSPAASTSSPPASTGKNNSRQSRS